ncbi:hypothetical protein KQI42_06810 [Tissierella sp. MSJ-40]|uniref:Flagellar assembly protein FliH/Type III secretion system HrpE domain-containing protein n=1 Tax=Tissierella simiarum TaxID=2841534 RepID=A0ABS6E5L5_9FIRM|nr:FliH/SctL family protein [Tissierella simiarum]MBU5437710.1 hypothetical protein [Tissierella simiarum]
MSNVIKSFRVVEKEDIPSIKDEDKENQQIKDVLIEEVKKECEILIKQAEERSATIITEANNLYEEKINSAHNKSKEIFQQSKDNGYKEGKDIGYSDGFEKGYDEGKRESDKLIKEALSIKESYLETKKDLLKDLEKDIVELVTTIYQKVLYEKNEKDNEMIISLVLNGISNLDPTDNLTIIASKEDFGVLEMSKDEILAKASLINNLEIKYDINLNKGDCILETSKGNIDVSLKNQLEEVKELLNTILDNE